jgi:hypothetical protein
VSRIFHFTCRAAESSYLFDLLAALSNYTHPSSELPVFDFTRLDDFLWKLINDYRLTPTIEFMTALRLKRDATAWEDLAYQLISRYIGVELINERN